MRIIDERRDYYDCIQRHGYDKTIVYLREESKITIPLRNAGNVYDKTKKAELLDDLFCVYLDGNSSRTNYSLELLVVGFCGKIYPCIEVNRRDPETVETIYGYRRTISDFFYKIEEADNLVEKLTSKKYLKDYQDNIRPKLLKFIKAAEEFNKKDFAVKIFTENKCPIFNIHQRDRCGSEFTIRLNCLLKDFQFYRVFDTNRTYQEIAMFVGNFAREFRPIPLISDEGKITSHGFNEFSFRKDPIKPRKKRK